MSDIASRIVKAALKARTLREAEALQDAIAAAVGMRHERPVGDKVNNFGLMSTGGSYDHKLIENVTNMHDALLERYAASRFTELSRVPYRSPREAAEELLAGVDESKLVAEASVELFDGDAPAKTSRKITALFRDEGCGIEPDYVARSIFALGSAHKLKAPWQQGAFGIGGAITFRNADAIVLVSRCAPELHPREDRIVVAVALWHPSEKGKGLYYLVTSDWDGGENLHAEPWSAPASVYPKFEPGTQLALINYGTEHIHAVTLHSDSPKSFERILDTRLFRPVAPTRVCNHLIRDDHPRTRRGLARRFEDNPRDDRREEDGLLPYRVGGKTYQLPLKYYYFETEAGSTKGQKANFVAAGHAVIFTSNGQIHHHWGPADFRERTGLMRLADNVLVTVETDPLPIAIRTDFFTADRSGVRASAEALRLEEAVAEFIRDWDELRKINGELIEQSLRGDGARETIDIARQISRAYALRMRGFSPPTNGTGAGAGKKGGAKGRQKIELYPDPTYLEGPEHVLAEQGTTKSIRFELNARDSFFASGRGQLSIVCSHPDIGADEIAVGALRDGRVRVLVSVPETAELGAYSLLAGIYDWERSSGGLGTNLEWQTRLEVVDEIRPPSSNGREKTGASEGPQVAIVWKAGHEVGLTPANPGKVEPVPANILAVARPEYAELAKLGDREVLTIYLNDDYSPFKRYLAARQRDLTDAKATQARKRYAVDVGVAMLVLENDRQKRITSGASLDEALLEVASDAAAQGALSILPDFDRIAKEAGIEG